MEKKQRIVRQSKRRQKYTRQACYQCKRRKLKCSGGPRCQRCTDRKVRCTYEETTLKVSSRYQGLDAELRRLQSCVDLALKQIEEIPQSTDDINIEAHDEELDALLDRISSGVDVLSRTRQISRQPFGPDHSSEPEVLQLTSTFTPKSLPFSKSEAIQLIEYFRFEGERFYPFVQYDGLLVLVQTVFEPSLNTPNFSVNSETPTWDDGLDVRNLDMLRLVIACALASKVNRETATGRDLASIASEKLASKVRGLTFDTKDIAIATLLSIYHLQCDETVLAWRQVSTAAKMCQELGLHKTLDGHPDWVFKMFWCIYVLDRRSSLMVNFPFTLHDEDIDHRIPAYDQSLCHLLSLIAYVRIASKFVPRIPKLGSKYTLMEPSTCISLDVETENWASLTSMTCPLTHNPDRLDTIKTTPEDQFNKAWVTVCKNQIKIALYKHYLFSSDNVYQNPQLSHKAVSSASDTIRSCSELQRATSMYDLQAGNLNFFVLSAIAALYLAVRNAPLQFSNAPRDFFTGLELLKTCCTSGIGSQRLCNKVSALESAMKKLGYNSLNLGPQLTVYDFPMDIGTPLSIGRGSKEGADLQRELSPISESFSSFLTQMMVAEGIESDDPYSQKHVISPQENIEWALSPPNYGLID